MNDRLEIASRILAAMYHECYIDETDYIRNGKVKLALEQADALIKLCAEDESKKCEHSCLTCGRRYRGDYQICPECEGELD